MVDRTADERPPVRSYRPERVTRAPLWAHGDGFRRGGLDMPEAERVAT